MAEEGERVVAHSEHEAAALISKFIAPPEPAPEGRRDERGRFVPAAQNAPAQAEPAAEAEPATTEEAAADGEKEQASDEAPEEKAETIEIDPEAPLFELTVKRPGGEDETKKVSLKDLKSGYMMQQDYYRKTAEVAEERRQAANAAKQAIEDTQKQYMQSLQQLQALAVHAAAPEFMNVDWGKLSTENPAEYVRLTARRDQIQQTLARIAQEQQKVTQAQQAEAEKAKTQAAQESVKRLQEHIPDWNDAIYQNLMKRAVDTYGYTSEEAASAVDDRFFRLLHDANAYRAMKAERPLVEKKLAEVPKLSKTAPRQNMQNQKGQVIKQARERLSRDNSVDAAADAMRLFITPSGR